MAKGGLGRIYRDGEVVIRQGERDGYMHVVQEGEVEVFVEKDGRELPLAVRGKGEVLGEMAIFDHAPHSATVRAHGDVRILTVDKRGFLRRIQEDPSLAFHILRNISIRVRDLSEKLAHYQEGLTSPEIGPGPVAAASPAVCLDGELAAPARARPSTRGLVELLDPGSQRPAARRLRAALRAAVCIGAAAAGLGSVFALPALSAIADAAVPGIVMLLAVEYALRLYAAGGPSAAPGRAMARLRYASSLAGLVDLMAVAPIALALALGARPDTVAILSTFWLLKLARYSPGS